MMVLPYAVVIRVSEDNQGDIVQTIDEMLELLKKSEQKCHLSPSRARSFLGAWFSC